MSPGFLKYPKIHRLSKEEVEGILLGTCVVQEKVDGANTQIWLEDGYIRCGSRNNDVTGKDFNGFDDYVHAHSGIREFFEKNPDFRLYGEWLVRHTISYKETAYKKFYLFDIMTPEGDFLPDGEVRVIADVFNIEMVPTIGVFENPTLEQLMEHVGKSQFGDRGEGVVIKNLAFRNGFGDMCYAKIVTETFKEDNAITFGGNNKFSDTYEEMYIVNKYVSVPRVKKVMDKLQPMVDHRLDMKEVPQVMGMVYHDIITEEGWDIAKRGRKLDFKKLQQLVNRKTKQVYVDILNDNISVADSTK